MPKRVLSGAVDELVAELDDVHVEKAAAHEGHCPEFEQFLAEV